MENIFTYLCTIKGLGEFKTPLNMVISGNKADKQNDIGDKAFYLVVISESFRVNQAPKLLKGLK